MAVPSLDRLFEVPAACERCHWNGRMAELIVRGSDPYPSPYRCPKCLEPSIIFIEAPSSNTLQ